jgi:hypothetical protein
MKIYPKRYENVFKEKIPKEVEDKISAVDSTLDELIKKYREFYAWSDRAVFEIMIKQTWLEMQLVFDGKRRLKKRRNGIRFDWIYGFFAKTMVGVAPKQITQTSVYTALSTYIKDFYPEFLEHNPFENPEYYKFPYENIGISHLTYVHMVHNRLELLEYAEEKSLGYAQFVNWVTNQVFCYNDEVGKDVYVLFSARDMWPYLKNTLAYKGWKDDMVDFSKKVPLKINEQLFTNKYVRIKSWKNPAKIKKIGTTLSGKNQNQLRDFDL